MNKAVFLDRDGVINELIYHREQEIIDSPFTIGQFKLLPKVCESVKLLHQAGYLVVLASNQPGYAKGYLSLETFELIRQKMNNELGKAGAQLDGEYYCLHHPEAIINSLRIDCDCRKPKPGLLINAAKDLAIDLQRSWFIGDSLSDIKAGKSAGCKTILLGKLKCEVCNLMDEQKIRPDAIISNLMEAVQSILK